jgi:hypothetical protein
MKRDDRDENVTVQGGQRSQPVAGHTADPKVTPDQRVNTSKFGRHPARILPTPVVLRNEYRKLAKDPKCGKRAAIPALAKKYRASQSAIRKTLEKKERKIGP